MKKWMTLLVFLPAATFAAPAVPEDTVTHVEFPNAVTVLETDSSLHVAIRGKAGDDSFRFDYTKDFGPGANVVTRQRSAGLDFNLPFTPKRDRRDRQWRQKHGTFCSMGGLGFGFVSAPGAPDAMHVDMGASYEIFADLLSFGQHLRHHADLSLGLGISWRNYRMTGRTRFLKEGDRLTLAPYPDGADIDFSRIKVFSLTFPLRFRQELSRHFSYSLAAILNLNTYASAKTHYDLDGTPVRDVQKRIHPSRVTVDFMGQFQYRSIGLYVKYSPCHMLHADFGPTFNHLSAGVTLFY